MRDIPVESIKSLFERLFKREDIIGDIVPLTGIDSITWASVGSAFRISERAAFL